MRIEADKLLLLIIFMLIVVGLVSVYSSTSVISPDIIEKGSLKGKPASPFVFLKKQLITVLIGIFVMFLAYKIQIEHLKKLTFPLLVLSLICLILVFTSLGVSAGGARRWIKAWPSVFQPSEIVKLSMVLFMAWYMSTNYFKTDKFISFVIPLTIMAIFQVIFIKQPDFGAVMSLGILTLTMLFIGGTKLKYLALIAVASLPIIAKLAFEPYRLKRITTFLNPWDDPLGSGFQLVQSFIALGSGGIIGVGLGEGRQKLSYLPEIHTDFIFSLIGEEMGFIGACFVVTLFSLLFIKGILIAKKTNDSFSSYLAYGITFMFAFQALINFAVVTGMVPTKGLPLPFISYGGSSLLVNMIAGGILLNISRQNNKRMRQDSRIYNPFSNSTISTPQKPIESDRVSHIRNNRFKTVYTFNRNNNTLF
ncbi:MAG TPA: putative lipid II flippase FtsW [Nitrospirae bacterium]|nr:putative lipid II flippase FtsW [Nitrospirota bacterium]